MKKTISNKIYITKVARDIFTRFGYKKTTMNDIAQASNKGKSSLYYYFQSKEEVFREVVESEAKILREKIALAVNKCTNPLDKVKEFVLTRMLKFPNYKNLYNALRSKNLIQLPFIIKFREQFEKSEIKSFENILREGVNRNYFHIHNVELAATAIIRAINGMEVPLYIKQSPISELEQTLRDTIGIILYGIVKR